MTSMINTSAKIVMPAAILACSCYAGIEDSAAIIGELALGQLVNLAGVVIKKPLEGRIKTAALGSREYILSFMSGTAAGLASSAGLLVSEGTSLTDLNPKTLTIIPLAASTLTNAIVLAFYYVDKHDRNPDRETPKS